VLATHEQLLHPCMPLGAFDALVEYLPWQHTAVGTQAAITGHSAAMETQLPAVQTVSASFGPGRHFVLDTEQPCLMQPAAAAGGVPQVIEPATAAADAAGAFPPAQPAPATAPPAAGSADLPLLLNCSSGGLLRRRPGLYQALLQLETLGFQLVERCLGRAGCGAAPEAGASATAVAGAAINVVASPRACICVWDAHKTPQVRSRWPRGCSKGGSCLVQAHAAHRMCPPLRRHHMPRSTRMLRCS
jgi:hypothetical protein